MLEELIELIAGYCEECEVTAESRLLEDLEFSSMELFSLISDVEDEFKVKIPEREIQKFESVEDIYNFINSQK